jgi:mono/diheme cytochrome c family protein
MKTISFEVTAGFCAVLAALLTVGATLGAAVLVSRSIQESRNVAKANASPVIQPALVTQGAKLFALNCSHCHADDATGDEGPDLHGLTKSDERIRALITNGVKGEMPSFKKKLGDADLAALVGFLRSLK